mmetsp:Transcript_24172/g.78797  ORF Transcript_24172/g.78797 Transcript_24172/m.78797 type:complete len:180 (+) Transcript_24172:256-795(+)
MMKLRESCIQVRSSSDCKFEWAPASSLLHSGSSGVESDVNKCISMLQQMFKGVSRCTCALILEYSRIRRIHAGASLALDGRTTSTVVLLEGQCIAARGMTGACPLSEVTGCGRGAQVRAIAGAAAPSPDQSGRRCPPRRSHKLPADGDGATERRGHGATGHLRPQLTSSSRAASATSCP